MDTQTEHRLKAYAQKTVINVNDVVSLKFRIIRSGVTYTDPSQRFTVQDLMHESEYQAGRRLCQFVPVESQLLKSVGSTISYAEEAWPDQIRQLKDTDPPVLWVEHETGLEILGAVSAVLGIMGFIHQVVPPIIETIKENAAKKNAEKQAGIPDSESRVERWNPQVGSLAIESRTLKEGHSIRCTLDFTKPVNIQQAYSVVQSFLTQLPSPPQMMGGS